MERKYSDKLSLLKNSRGIYSLDTVMGCSGGVKDDAKGCFSDCFAAKSAKQYGYDFSINVLRRITDDKHKISILRKIENASMPFIRIGTSGDPSGDWEHTISVLEQLKEAKKPFVIITRHFNLLNDGQLDRLRRLNVCVNTSVSALDDSDDMNRCLEQFERLKPYCDSVLRVVTCDFNTFNPVGFKMAKTQDFLISIDVNYIDTVFRPSKSNKLIKGNVINTKDMKFLGKEVKASKLNKKTFFGKCAKCPEMCGINQ